MLFRLIHHVKKVVPMVGGLAASSLQSHHCNLDRSLNAFVSDIDDAQGRAIACLVGGQEAKQAWALIEGSLSLFGCNDATSYGVTVPKQASPGQLAIMAPMVFTTLCTKTLPTPKHGKSTELCGSARSSRGKRGCGKSRVIRALAGTASGPLCQTLGLQVTTCWWGGGQQGSLEQPCTRSLYDFWEVHSEYATCKYVGGKNVVLIVQVGSAGCSRDSSLLAAAKHSAAVALLVVSISDRFGFSDLPASVAELQPMPCIVIVTKTDIVQSWAMTLVGPYFSVCCCCMMLVPELTLFDTVKADINRMAAEQKVPVYLMGVTSTGSSGAINSQANLGTHPTMECVQTAVMSQILSSANASLL